MPVHVQEQINHFLFNFYQGRKFFTCIELENLNNLLTLLIRNFKEHTNDKFCSQILLFHFRNASASFVKAKRAEDGLYVKQVRRYFLCLHELVRHLRERQQGGERPTGGLPSGSSEEDPHLVVSIVKYVNLFLVSALRLVERNCLARFYCTIISDGRVAEMLANAYGQNEQADEDIIHSFVLLAERKEFDKDIIKCGIMKKITTSEALLQRGVSCKSSFLIQVVIKIAIRNLKQISVYTSKSDLQFVNSLVEIVHHKITKGEFDLSCADLLRLFSYIIEGGRSSADSPTFGHRTGDMSGTDEVLFFQHMHKLIGHVDCLVRSADLCNRVREKDDPLGHFLGAFFCALRNVLQVVLNCGESATSAGCKRTESCPHSCCSSNPLWTFRQDSQLRGEAQNLICSILDLTLGFLAHCGSPLPDEKKMLHLLCFDIVNAISSCHCASTTGKKKIAEKMIPLVSRINSNEKDAEGQDNYLYLKHVEALFCLCLHNEDVCREFFTEEFVKLVEELYLQIDQREKIENVKKKEEGDLLKLYYFGILYTFAQMSVHNEKEREKKKKIFLPFVNYVIVNELQKKKFLLENHVYCLLFLRFLNMSLLNNLYDFKKFAQGVSLVHFLKVVRGVDARIKTVALNVLLQWVERDPCLKLIKTHLKTNKQIFHILLEIWVLVQAEMAGEKKDALAASSKWENVLYTIHHIFKRLTNGFTKYLSYFSEHEDLLSNFKRVMTFEEKSVLEIYSQMCADVEANRLEILEKDKNYLNGKAKSCAEKIEQMEKRLQVTTEESYRKNVDELENYYNYVRAGGEL
ncbi:conserved Plasmodium protein, unknown function [Plasmodium vivax]|uniref:(malaria parasite P. vivax) hypothetical protein n=1 Tax=Plasmodium vivax TaxID=5855 RepID=A0A1G4GY44_PLAVI|nr:unnamed protein product [Plasmodium vivax]SCO67534.1 conserved Plasmodium protein, unknown function [Plasmodium vivax]SCO72920.1 conserved Plasmodium protein, unknown function [Plasmodium vivax]VUZ96118.1 conserved Plasmodium protein, unknown function [Plasmodium vivax]